MLIKDFLKERNLDSTYSDDILEFEILLLARVGSHLYGTNSEGSDEDFKGIYIIPEKYLFGLGSTYYPQLAFGELDSKGNPKGDNVFFEIGRYIELLLSSNPGVLELLFLDDENLIYRHPILHELICERTKFLTKQCKYSVGGYASAQIQKSQGQNKFQNWNKAKTKRKTPLDFISVIQEKETIPIIDWLKQNDLDQAKCGLVPIPHTYDKLIEFIKHHADINDWQLLSFHLSKQLQILSKYGVLDVNGFSDSLLVKINNLNAKLDVMKHNSNIQYQDVLDLSNAYKHLLEPLYKSSKLQPKDAYKYIMVFGLFYEDKPEIKYNGIIKMNQEDEIVSNEIRLSSIPKNERIKAFILYDLNSYSTHCKEYQNYQTWLKERNLNRWVDVESHKQQIDGKNLMHCVRLLSMSREIAEGKGMILKRPDADKLIDIRKGKVDLQTIIDQAKNEIKIIDEIYDNCDLPESIDKTHLNELLTNLRLRWYNNSFWRPACDIRNS